jgi:hypothetical protein
VTEKTREAAGVASALLLAVLVALPSAESIASIPSRLLVPLAESVASALREPPVAADGDGAAADADAATIDAVAAIAAPPEGLAIGWGRVPAAVVARSRARGEIVVRMPDGAVGAPGAPVVFGERLLGFVSAVEGVRARLTPIAVGREPIPGRIHYADSNGERSGTRLLVRPSARADLAADRDPAAALDLFEDPGFLESARPEEAIFVRTAEPAARLGGKPIAPEGFLVGRVVREEASAEATGDEPVRCVADLSPYTPDVVCVLSPPNEGRGLGDTISLAVGSNRAGEARTIGVARVGPGVRMIWLVLAPGSAAVAAGDLVVSEALEAEVVSSHGRAAFAKDWGAGSVSGTAYVSIGDDPAPRAFAPVEGRASGGGASRRFVLAIPESLSASLVPGARVALSPAEAPILPAPLLGTVETFSSAEAALVGASYSRPGDPVSLRSASRVAAAVAAAPTVRPTSFEETAARRPAAIASGTIR